MSPMGALGVVIVLAVLAMAGISSYAIWSSYRKTALSQKEQEREFVERVGQDAGVQIMDGEC